MDRNTVTAVVLMALVVFGFSYWSSRNKSAEQTQNTEVVAQSKDKKSAAHAASVQQTDAAPLDSTALFAQASVANDSLKPVVLSNDKIEVTIAPKGGQISQVLLKEYKSYKEYN